jgi:hypothetical protein
METEFFLVEGISGADIEPGGHLVQEEGGDPVTM